MVYISGILYDFHILSETLVKHMKHTMYNIPKLGNTNQIQTKQLLKNSILIISYILKYNIR